MSWKGVKQVAIAENIKAWCDEIGIDNYTINDKGEIDVDGSVYLNYRLSGLEELPYKFGRVSGDFNMSYNGNIKSLKNCPNFIGDSFSCSYCSQLDSLKGCPKVIRRFFICEECKVKFTKKEVKSLCKIGKIHNIFV